jgi:Oxidoreductase molybdopterin binding domain
VGSPFTSAPASRAAGPGEVVVSSAVKDLVAGSGISFADRGAQVLKGVPGEWRLFAVERRDHARGSLNPCLWPNKATRISIREFLPRGKAFPLRLVAPGEYGYKSVKWVKKIKFSSTREHDFNEKGAIGLGIPPIRISNGKVFLIL